MCILIFKEQLNGKKYLQHNICQGTCAWIKSSRARDLPQSPSLAYAY